MSLRVLRAMPDPIPPGRSYVHDPHAEWIWIQQGRYGEALREATRPDGDGYLLLEWDLALDRDDMVALEAMIRGSRGREVVVAPYKIWAASHHDARSPGEAPVPAGVFPIQDKLSEWCLWQVEQTRDVSGRGLLVEFRNLGHLQGVSEQGLQVFREVTDALGLDPYRYQEATEGDLWVDIYGFGCTFLPQRLLEQAWAEGLASRMHFPSADRTFSIWAHQRGERALVAWACRPKHLHDRRAVEVASRGGP